ncbi:MULTISPECIES: hypothetical protein [Prevotellaceae]|uniref:hypothetical protein n=1 Tax=Prevotellaceae TaxID=171552 RepID=UPI0003D2DE29|nr:hypothetical protein [Prevotella phocaeensis]ETD21329.1 hypothetical protein HMPREF1199_00399 [Hoylesella oralis CC98A]
MNDLKILNHGRTDLLNPMNDEEMNFLTGGVDSQVEVSCKKGYTSMECKCGYQGPAFLTERTDNLEKPATQAT